MSPRQSRKGAHDDKSDDGMQMSDTPHTERRHSSLPSSPHLTVAGKCKSQFLCLFQDQDDRSTPLLRFLLWVAYGQMLAGPNQINDANRLRCPIMQCLEPCPDQSRLLEHVFRCAQYSDGRYWCFHCQNEESFASYQAPPFRKDRLSVRAKRIFRWLGKQASPKDHESSTTLLSSNRSSSLCNQHYPANTPDSMEASSMTAEMEDSKVLRELGDEGIPVPAELYSECIPSVAFELDAPFKRSESRLHHTTREGVDLALSYTTMDDTQSQSPILLSPDERFRQFHMENEVKLAASEVSLHQHQSPVSPQGPEWMAAGFIQARCESPTSTDFTDESKFFGCDISVPSTGNSTLQGFPYDLSGVDQPSEYFPTLRFLPDIADKIPKNVVQEDFTCEELAINSPILGPFRATEQYSSVRLGSSQWLSPKDVLRDFLKVLRLHVAESSAKLNTLPKNPLVNELLSMDTETIAYTGLSVWKSMVQNHYPATIAHLYALVHATYAFAIVAFDGQLGNHLDGLFADSLEIGVGALPDEEKLIYANIVSSIWSPPLGELHSGLNNPAEFGCQPDQAPSSLLQTTAKSRTLIDTKECLNQPFYAKGALGAVELQPNESNSISNILDHFLDIFVGITFCTEVSSANGDPSLRLINKNFVRTVKDHVFVPLKEYLQSSPPLSALIQVVTVIESLVDIGKIITVHDLQVTLIWTARSTAQSMALYERFSNRVKGLCSGIYLLLEDPALQATIRLQRINEMCISLKATISEVSQPNIHVKHQYQSVMGSSTPPSLPMPSNSTIFGTSQSSDASKVELSRRPAVKRKRSSGQLPPETGPSPASSSCSNTLSESSESDYSRCSKCGFRPTGAPRWYKRTLTRHMETHLQQDQKKVYRCRYDDCSSSFGRPDNLQHHLRTVHQQDK